MDLTESQMTMLAHHILELTIPEMVKSLVLDDLYGLTPEQEILSIQAATTAYTGIERRHLEVMIINKLETTAVYSKKEKVVKVDRQGWLQLCI